MGQDKKHEKQLKRDRKKAVDRQNRASRERERLKRDQYPHVIIDPTNGDPEFVRLVTEANAEIRFDDPELFPEFEQIFYKELRKNGDTKALDIINQASKILVAEGQDVARFLEVHVTTNYGTQLLKRIPEDTLKRFLPYNDVFVIPAGQHLYLKFSSMLSQRGPHGTVFFSRLKPKVTFDEKSWIVAFSRHAIEQICNRLNPRYLSYGAAGDIHGFFSAQTYFEPVRLCDGQFAFVLYDSCANPTFANYNTYVEQILGEENLNPSLGTPHYVVGYCPVAFEGEFAKAQSFLYPGYNNTPECGLIQSAKVTDNERRRLFGKTKNLTAEDVIVNDNTEIIKWFHENGVPQVKLFKHDIFDFSKVYGFRSRVTTTN